MEKVHFLKLVLIRLKCFRSMGKAVIINLKFLKRMTREMVFTDMIKTLIIRWQNTKQRNKKFNYKALSGNYN